MSERPDFEHMNQPALVKWLLEQKETPRGNISKANALAWAQRKWTEMSGGEPEVVAEDEPEAEAEEEVVAGDDDAPAQEDAASEEQPAAEVEPEAPVIPIDRPDGFDDSEWDTVCEQFAALRPDLHESYLAMVVTIAEFQRLSKIVPPDPPPAPPGMVNLFTRQKDGYCSYGGSAYEIVDGVVSVPFDAMAELKPHGFSPTPF